MVYMKFSMPELPGYANIESASFNFWYTADAASGALNMKAYIVNFPWDESSLNWTTASHTNFGMDTSWWTGAGLTVSTSPKKFTMNITGAVKKWFGEDRIPNYGLAFKRVGGKITTATIMSSEAASTYRPYAVITYSLDLPVAEGTYYIRNGYHHNLFMRAKTGADDWDDSSTSVTSGDKYCEMFDPPTSPSDDDSAEYKWTFTYLNNGYYSIRSYDDGTYLTVRQGKENTGNFILDRDQVFSGYNNQQWKITKNQDNRYKIEPRSSESYTTDWVMAVKSGNDNKEKGYNVIQAVNSGTAHSEWYIESLSPTPRMRLNVTIKYDDLVASEKQDAENLLSTEFQKAADMFLIVYGIQLTICDIHHDSSIAVDSRCEVIDDPDAHCIPACAPDVQCSTLHHKSSSKFYATTRTPTERTCRVVGFAICGRPGGNHGPVLGATYSKGTKEFVVTTKNREKESDTIHMTMQHELSHTFGSLDHDIVNGRSCVITKQFGYWCIDCYNAINDYIEDPTAY